MKANKLVSAPGAASRERPQELTPACDTSLSKSGSPNKPGAEAGMHPAAPIPWCPPWRTDRLARKGGPSANARRRLAGRMPKANAAGTRHGQARFVLKECPLSVLDCHRAVRAGHGFVGWDCGRWKLLLECLRIHDDRGPFERRFSLSGRPSQRRPLFQERTEEGFAEPLARRMLLHYPRRGDRSRNPGYSTARRMNPLL